MQERESRLAEVVDQILDSYREHGHINHLDGTNLPSRAEVSGLVDNLLALVFPGFFQAERLDQLTARYAVGQRCVQCLTDLEQMIHRVAVSQHGGSPPSGDPSESKRHSAGHALALMQQIPAIRELLSTDVRAALAGDPAATSAEEVITSYPGIKAIAVHRIAHALYRRKVPILPRMMTELVNERTGIDIHPGARIDHSFFIDHGTGVVIGETCQIGHHVKLYQGVTLGALSTDAPRVDGDDGLIQRHPTLEDYVTVYAGATILGGDTIIGRGSVIGGNVWLTKTIRSCSKVIATPPSARIQPRTAEDGPCADAESSPNEGERTQ